MLECHHITKRYNGEKVNKDISMKFENNGLVSIVGHSGCGKTTLLHILGGILKEYGGEVLYNGKNIRLKSTHYHKNVAFIFQDIYLIMWLNIKNNISISRYFYKGHFDLKQLKDDFHVLKMFHLSLGQRQKISYLRAAYTNAPILLCDEPTGSLDEESADLLMQELKQLSLSKLVIMISHDHKLVEKYSDEIYEMKDGEIINHTILSINENKENKCEKQYKYPFSLLMMTYYSMSSHKKHFYAMIVGLLTTLLCIMLTLTLSSGLQQHIRDYIYSIVPSSCISFKMKTNTSIEQSMVEKIVDLKGVQRCQLFLDHYELLGIGLNKERYKESETLFIQNDSEPYEKLTLDHGRYPLEEHEIIISLTTAKKLSQNINNLLNKKIYAWYKRGLKVINIEYTIVGICENKMNSDSLYQIDNAYISLIKNKYASNKDFKTSLGLIYIDPSYNRDDYYQKLINTYKDYEFLKVGESTYENVKTMIKRIEIVFACFTCLSVLSCLLLIGEVTYLNIIRQKKDFIIMKCFGATHYDVVMIVFLEIIFIFIMSILLCLSMVLGLIHIISVLSTKYLLSQILVTLNSSIILKTIGIGAIMIMISLIPSFISLKNFDSQVLKE